MAEDTYSLKFTAINQDGGGINGTGNNADLIAPNASARSPLAASAAGQQMPGLDHACAGLEMALVGARLEISLLTAEQSRLRAVLESIDGTLSSQRSLLQAMNDKPAPTNTSGAGEEAKTKALGGDNPPYEPLRPAINLDAAMAELGLVIRFEGDQRRQLAITNEQMASERLVAPSRATAVDLARVEFTAAQAGIGNDQRDAAGNVDTLARQKSIVEFTRDAAITASAFRMPAKDAAELLIGWRTSMNLDRGQTQDLADATSVLGRGLSASEADIGSILSNYGAAGTNSGLTPEQAAALSAALLNAGVKTADAGVTFEKITTTLARGEATSPGQLAAWAQLGLDPKALANGMQKDAPSTIVSVLEALKAQPVTERSGLATQLFSVDKPILQMLQNIGEVDRAFALVSDKKQYATSQLHDQGAVQQSALKLSDSSQSHWNVFNAQLDRLKISSGNSVLPMFDALLAPTGAAVNGLSRFAEAFPVATGALLVGAAAFKGVKIVDKVKGWLGEGSGNGAAKGNGGGAGTGGLGRTLRTRASALGSLAVTRLQTVQAQVMARAQALGAVANSRLAGLTSSTGRRLMGQGTRVGRVAGSLARPLMLVDAGLEVVEGIRKGDARLVGGGLGSAAGGLAGSYAGAGAGAIIGTFFSPGAATFVGGLLGGVVGGAAGSAVGHKAGSWLGEQLGRPVNRLDPPSQVSKNLVGAQMNNRPINFAPVINITGQDPTHARQIANLVTQTLHAQFVPLMMANPLAARRNAALTDGGI